MQINQKTSTGTADFLVEKFYNVKTQEAYSVLRTLHALKGFRIREALELFLESPDARQLSFQARRELTMILSQ